VPAIAVTREEAGTVTTTTYRKEEKKVGPQ